MLNDRLLDDNDHPLEDNHKKRKKARERKRREKKGEKRGKMSERERESEKCLTGNPSFMWKVN